MINKGSFSVVIPTLNRNRLLYRALISIEKSSLLPTEVIVINDGGTAVSSRIIDDFSFVLKVTNLASSKGANFCRNYGARIATEQIIFFLDDDDALTTKSLEKRYSLLNRLPNIGLVYTGIKIVKSNSLDKIVRVSKPITMANPYMDLLRKGNLIGSTSRIAVRKSSFESVGMFDESLPCLQDYDLYLRMAKVTNVMHDDDSNLVYTIHEDGSQKSTAFLKYEKACQKIYHKHKNAIEENKLQDNFMASAYLRCALAASRKNSAYKTIYALKSLLLKPSLRAVAVIIIPHFVLSRIRAFT